MFFIAIIILRTSYIRNKKFKKYRRDRWEPIILDYLSEEISLDQAIIKLKIKSSDMSFFTDFVSDYLGSLAGSEYEDLIDLLKGLNLVDWEVDRLKKRNVWIKVFALSHLGIIKDKRTIPRIKESLKDRRPVVVYSAAQALSAMRDQDSFDEVAATLLKGDAWNQIRTAEVFLQYGGQVVERLIKYLKDPEIVTERKALVVDILSEFKCLTVADELLRLAEKTTDIEVKTSIIKYLGNINYLEAKEFLVKSLSDPNWIIRSQAAKSLGLIGDPSILDSLTPLLSDEVWWVRYLAAQALGEIGPEGWEKLTATREQAGDNFARDISRQILDEMEIG